jgi:hypothetical protein
VDCVVKERGRGDFEQQSNQGTKGWDFNRATSKIREESAGIFLTGFTRLKRRQEKWAKIFRWKTEQEETGNGGRQ